MDREGRSTPVASAKRSFIAPAMSPDGRRIAVIVEGVEDALWVLDVESGTLNRMTFDTDVSSASWSSDGESIFYTGTTDGPRSVYAIAGDGSRKAEMIFGRAPVWVNEVGTHPDRSGLMMAAQDVGGHDLLFVRHGSSEEEPFLVTPLDERGPAFSPKGDFVAYFSNESGRMEVYVRPYPGPGAKRQISTNGGATPSWSPDGRELFYFEPGPQPRLMRASFEADPQPRVGKPEVLFEVPPRGLDRVSFTPDGRQFVMVQPEPEEERPLTIVVIPGFLEDTQARLTEKRP
jgi:Tol biopolymer transport system component